MRLNGLTFFWSPELLCCGTSFLFCQEILYIHFWWWQMYHFISHLNECAAPHTTSVRYVIIYHHLYIYPLQVTSFQEFFQSNFDAYFFFISLLYSSHLSQPPCYSHCSDVKPQKPWNEDCNIKQHSHQIWRMLPLLWRMVFSSHLSLWQLNWVSCVLCKWLGLK